MSDHISRQIEELEIKLSFQEDTIDQLNNIITRQQHEIDRLSRSVELLSGQFKQIIQEEGIDNTPVRPPHY